MKSKVIYMVLYGFFVCLVFASSSMAAVVKKNWINVHKVLMENETVQNQKYAELITNAVEVGVKTVVPGGLNAWWVYIPLHVKTIDAVQLGYLYKPSSGIVSQIDQINIIKVAAPGKQGDTVYEAKSLALNSAVYTFHKISTPHLFANEGFLLAVKIIFKNHRDRFIIGPIGIEEYGATIEEVNPVDFGAVGDGKADDTKALQDAIDYAIRNKIPLNLASGIYLTTDTLKINAPTIVSLNGNNYMGRTLDVRDGVIVYNGTTTAVRVGYLDDPPPAAGAYNIVNMTNTSIVGTSSAQIGLDLGKALQSNFTNVNVNGFTGTTSTGVMLRGATSNRFFNCNFSDNFTNVYFKGFKQKNGAVTAAVPANDNKFWGCTLNYSVGTASVYFQVTPLNPNRSPGNNNAFHGCTVETNKRGILMEAGFYNSFVDNRFEGVTEGAHIKLMEVGFIDQNGSVATSTIDSTRIINNLFTPGAKDEGMIYIGEEVTSTRLIANYFSGGTVTVNKGIDTEYYANRNLKNCFNTATLPPCP